ncbi:MAG: hypothetical protein ACOCZE_03995 [Planctomycetota bacterium]
MAIYSRALSDQQVASHYQAYQAKLAQRRDVPVLQVRAKVAATSQVPTMKQIAPYRRALVVHEYELQKHLSGPEIRPGRKIRVVEWALLDGQTQPAAKRKVGQSVELKLEPHDAQGQLKGLVISDTLDIEAETPCYFAVP